ncbi:MAG: cation:proton antiporter [Actinobacteria bacterium]|nr:cation:proton antiporter [Actinomycetota bacterium]
MDVSQGIYSLLVIAAIAAAVPLIVGLLRLPIAEVVLLLAGGIVFGPSGLGWIQLDETILLFSEIGLAFLFFAAGLELEKHAIRGRSGKLALIGWITTVVLACLAAALLEYLSIIRDFLGVAIALTSTALGTLLPILRDKGLLKTPFGTYFMGAGAIGEFGPILAISILLTTANPAMGFVAVALFAVVALAFAKVPGWLKFEQVVSIIDRGHGTSSQTAIRLTVLLLLGLVATAELFGLDVALGAFVAGVILKLFATKSEENLLQTKLTGVAFGVFIPLFFIVSGAKLDIRSILEYPQLLTVFTVLLLLVRGVPQFVIYRRAIPQAGRRAQFSLYVATALPIIVAVTTIQVDNGTMKSQVGAALVGAGALSVLIFPLLGQFLGRRVSAQPERSDAIT